MTQTKSEMWNQFDGFWVMNIKYTFFMGLNKFQKFWFKNRKTISYKVMIKFISFFYCWWIEIFLKKSWFTLICRMLWVSCFVQAVWCRNSVKKVIGRVVLLKNNKVSYNSTLAGKMPSLILRKTILWMVGWWKEAKLKNRSIIDRGIIDIRGV